MLPVNSRISGPTVEEYVARKAKKKKVSLAGSFNQQPAIQTKPIVTLCYVIPKRLSRRK